MSEKYNGWKNYETWNVALWAGNSESAYLHVRENRPYTARKAKKIGLFLYPAGTPDMRMEDFTNDLMGRNAMNKVDWEEIAAAWNEE